MPTEPLRKLLDRDFSRVSVSEYVNDVCPLLQEIINYATNAWRRCETSTSGEPGEDLAPIVLYLHMIEMADAIEVLIRESCVNPAKPIVRSLFEASLGIEYILEDETHYAERSLSWLVVYAHERLDSYRCFDPNSGRGKNELPSILADKFAGNMQWPSQQQVQQAMVPLTKFLKEPHVSPIEAEYQRSKRKGKPYWYTLFQGPSNLAGLAKRLNRFAQYALLYRDWSAVAHAGDLSRFISRDRHGQPAFWSLRHPGELRLVASLTIGFLVESTKQMLMKYRPSERQDYERWYTTEVHDRYMEILQTKIVIGSVD